MFVDRVVVTQGGDGGGLLQASGGKSTYTRRFEAATAATQAI